MAGKTTLVSALLEAGASYYSDEYAVFDPRGVVYPYAKRLSIRQPGGLQRRNTAGELHATTDTVPLPVGLVAVTHFSNGASWNGVSISPGQCALDLLANTICARTRSADALNVFTRVAIQAFALSGARGDARAAAAALLAELDQRDRLAKMTNT